MSPTKSSNTVRHGRHAALGALGPRLPLSEVLVQCFFSLPNTSIYNISLTGHTAFHYLANRHSKTAHHTPAKKLSNTAFLLMEKFSTVEVSIIYENENGASIRRYAYTIYSTGLACAQELSAMARHISTRCLSLYELCSSTRNLHKLIILQGHTHFPFAFCCIIKNVTTCKRIIAAPR